MRRLQETHSMLRGCNTSASLWGPGLVTRLLEITHGQWLYRCVQIHDKTQGTLITNRKENLQRQIEEEMDKGWDDLLEEDQYLAEVNLENQVRLTNYLATELSNLHKALEGQMAALDERFEKGIGTLDAAENEQWLELTKQMESELKKTEEQIQFLETWMLANQQRGIPNVAVLKGLEKLNQ